MAVERIVNTSTKDEPEEQELEQTLRPRDFKSYVGQTRLKKNLQLAISAAKKRGDQRPGHRAGRGFG
jgi:Holliday junction DNA helicase RuvB